MNERRIDSRYLCADIVRVTWSEPMNQKKQSSEAVLEDICSRGICLQMDQAIPEGSHIHAFLGEADFEGQVSYCTFQNIGYFIGVHFDDQARWNTHVYNPPHLTDLRELVLRGH